MASRLSRIVLASSAIALVLPLVGCVVAPVAPAPYAYNGGGYGYSGEVVPVAPPPPQAEYYGPPPMAGYVWLGGYWGWNGHAHTWVGGHWAAPRAGYHWVPHAWVHQGSGWRMAEGHWAR
jgi:hypothetical protein